MNSFVLMFTKVPVKSWKNQKQNCGHNQRLLNPADRIYQLNIKKKKKITYAMKKCSVRLSRRVRST